MKKKHNYFYNRKTLQFEKNVTSFSQKVYNFLGFLSVSFITAIVLIWLFGKYWESAEIKIYKKNISDLNTKFVSLDKTVEEMKKELRHLEKRDNDIYRSIFQANNLEDSLREIEMQENRYSAQQSSNISFFTLYDSIEKNVYTLKNKISFQMKSYVEIDKLILNKEALLKATPAIQPISNTDLGRIASGFGYRIDPVYKTEKFHEGLDFTAPPNTPIYATADGTIEKMEAQGGYGNHIVIDHGYGYKTLYGHLFKYNTHLKKVVKRGEVIGYVGNTGKSTGPHCHYEVIKNGIKVNPIYYFFNDLTPEQFQKITIIANQRNQSLD